MTHIEDEEEKPLDPAVEHIRRRMLRSLFVSIGILMAGLFAIFFAIIYKINSGEEDTSNVSQSGVIPGDTAGGRGGKRSFLSEINVDIPDSAEVLSTQLRRGRLVVELEIDDGSVEVWIVDMVSGTVESRVTIR